MEREKLVYSEVRDLVELTGVTPTLDDLIEALIQFRDDPPEPDPPARSAPR